MQMTKKHIKNTAMRRVNQLIACWVIFHGYFFQNQLFRKILSGIPPECQT